MRVNGCSLDRAINSEIQACHNLAGANKITQSDLPHLPQYYEEEKKVRKDMKETLLVSEVMHHIYTVWENRHQLLSDL